MNTTHDNGQPADGDTVARFREQLRRDVIAKAARLRGELARDELRRWENFAAAVLRVAARSTRSACRSTGGAVLAVVWGAPTRRALSLCFMWETFGRYCARRVPARWAMN